MMMSNSESRKRNDRPAPVPDLAAIRPLAEEAMTETLDHLRSEVLGVFGDYWCEFCNERLPDGLKTKAELRAAMYAHLASVLDAIPAPTGPTGEREALCRGCSHPVHHDSDCGFIVGYDHLNGDHECGCPGETFDWVEWCQDVTGVYVTSVEEGRKAVQDLVMQSMQLIRELTAPTPHDGTEVRP